MPLSFALKRLTASDLTLFKWHFENRNAGNQKAINLNASVFVGELFPSIEAAARGMGARLPLDLWIYGPGSAPPINLQRKIIKGGAYKNWRLNGEFINNPDEEPDRFNVLEPNDFALIGFEGDLVPTGANILFVSKRHPDDQALHGRLNQLIGAGSSMVSLSEDVVRGAAGTAGLAPSHPIYALALTEDLKEASQGAAPAIERVLRVARAISISPTDLKRAREAAEDNGRLGEELIDSYLGRQVGGRLKAYEWTSQINVIAPFDFRLWDSGGESLVDVKTTSGPFDRDLHISVPELRVMASDTHPYRIYRVFGVSLGGARLRISAPVREFALSILRGFEALPRGVTVDSVSVDPRQIEFGEEIGLVPPSRTEEG